MSKWDKALSSQDYRGVAFTQESLAKGKYSPKKPPAGINSLLEDPMAIQYAMGYKDRKYSLSYDVLKRIPQQLAIVNAIFQTRINQIASFAVPMRMSKSLGYEVKHKDPSHNTTDAEREMIQSIETFIYQCGASSPNPHNERATKRDDFETFLRKIVRDSLMYDQCCWEIVPNRKGEPYEFVAVDASTIRFAEPDSGLGPNDNWYDRNPVWNERGNAHEGSPYRTNNYKDFYSRHRREQKPAFVQIIDGQIHATYTADELAFGVRNPRTDLAIQGYGYSELEQAITIVTSHLYAEEYNRRFFMQGCVSGDTLVHSDSGIIPIRDFPVNIEDKFKPVGKLWNGVEWVSFDVVKTADKKATITTLINDFEITTSNCHKFLSINDSGQLEQVPIDQLSPGDFVATNEINDKYAATDVLIVKKSIHVGNGKSSIIETGVADTSLYEFVGYLVGDGYISDNIITTEERGPRRQTTVSCVINSKDKEVSAKIETLLKVHGISFHNKLSGGQWGGTPLDTIVIRNKGFFDFLFNEVGVSCEKSHLKSVPTHIFIASAEHRAAFLRGLFSADGCVKGNGAKRVFYTSSSLILIQGVQQLLWSLGIDSKIDSSQINSSSGRRCYQLRIRNSVDFFSYVGFIQSYKNDNFRNASSKGTVLVNGPVPKQVADAICIAALKKIPKQDFTEVTGIPVTKLTQHLRGKINLGFTLLKEIVTIVDLPEFLEVFNYRWTKIVKINRTDIVIPMFDIRQEDSRHQWSAGGCIVSNSAPKGLLNFKGDEMTPDMLEGFKRHWRANLEGVENSWKTLITQSEQGVEWIDLQKTNQDMEYSQWVEYLLKILCALFLIDPAELNFDLAGGVSQTPLFESSSEWKLKASRDRGLKPMLRFIAKLINEHIVSKIDDRFTFDFVGLDELTENEKHELRVEQLNSYKTMNEIRREQDLPDIEYGDVPSSPAYIQARAALIQEKLQQEQGAAGGQPAPGGAPQGGGQPAPGGQDDKEEEEDSPAYADRFTKALPPILEVSFDDDEWISIVRDV